MPTCEQGIPQETFLLVCRTQRIFKNDKFRYIHCSSATNIYGSSNRKRKTCIDHATGKRLIEFWVPFNEPHIMGAIIADKELLVAFDRSTAISGVVLLEGPFNRKIMAGIIIACLAFNNQAVFVAELFELARPKSVVQATEGGNFQTIATEKFVQPAIVSPLLSRSIVSF